MARKSPPTSKAAAAKSAPVKPASMKPAVAATAPKKPLATTTSTPAAPKPTAPAAKRLAPSSPPPTATKSPALKQAAPNQPAPKPAAPQPSTPQTSAQRGPASKPAAAKRVAAIPPGHPRVSPYLVTPDAARVIEFTKRVLGSEVLYSLAGPDGKVMHAEVKIVDSVLMLSEASDAFPAMPAMLHIYVEDSDKVFAKAVAAGATVVRPVSDQFYGDRSGGVKDHAGNQWWFSTHVEDVSPEEIGRRAAAFKK